MASSHFLGPVAAPHKTPQFWLFVVVLTIALLCAPFGLRLLYPSLSAISLHGWLSSAVSTLAIGYPVVWLGFRFGRVAWFLIGVGFVVLGLSLRVHG